MQIDAAKADLRYRFIQQEDVYIAMSEHNFLWLRHEVTEVAQLWRAGEHIADIAGRYGRPQEEVAILIMDLAAQDKVSERAGGVMGREEG